MQVIPGSYQMLFTYQIDPPIQLQLLDFQFQSFADTQDSQKTYIILTLSDTKNTFRALCTELSTKIKINDIVKVWKWKVLAQQKKAFLLVQEIEKFIFTEHIIGSPALQSQLFSPYLQSVIEPLFTQTQVSGKIILQILEMKIVNLQESEDVIYEVVVSDSKYKCKAFFQNVKLIKLLDVVECLNYKLIQTDQKYLQVYDFKIIQTDFTKSIYPITEFYQLEIRCSTCRTVIGQVSESVQIQEQVYLKKVMNCQALSEQSLTQQLQVVQNYKCSQCNQIVGFKIIGGYACYEQIGLFSINQNNSLQSQSTQNQSFKQSFLDKVNTAQTKIQDIISDQKRRQDNLDRLVGDFLQIYKNQSMH